MRTLMLTAILIAGVPVSQLAAESKIVPRITIVQPYARETPAGSTNGVAYLQIQAAPGIPDALIAVETPAAVRAEIHSHTMVGDVMQMRRIDSLELNPGGLVALEPRGNHIMLMDLKSALKVGDKVHLTLTFKSAGKMDIDVPVIALGALPQ